jgi:hypothetical protein
MTRHVMLLRSINVLLALKCLPVAAICNGMNQGTRRAQCATSAPSALEVSSDSKSLQESYPLHCTILKSIAEIRFAATIEAAPG